MIKPDCKCLGRRGASAIGGDTQEEDRRKKQVEVCRFLDLVSRIIKPTWPRQEAESKTLSGTREWQGVVVGEKKKRDWPSM